MFKKSSRKAYIAYTLIILMITTMFMAATAAVAFCADGNGFGTAIQDAVSSMTEDIYGVMRAIIIPCCILALGLAGFQFLVGGAQGAEKARKICMGVIGAVAFVVFAPTIGAAIGTWVKNEGTGTWDNYNPLK